MAVYKSALGKPIDMAALAAKNERVRAVGNQNVNARGDTIDANGNIIVPASKKVGERYAKTVTNKSANIVKNKPNNHFVPVDTIQQHIEQLTPEEQQIEADAAEELAIERAKAGKK